MRSVRPRDFQPEASFQPALSDIVVNLSPVRAFLTIVSFKSYRSWLGSFSAKLGEHCSVNPRRCEAGWCAFCIRRPPGCEPRSFRCRFGVYAGKQFGMLLAGAVLSVALFDGGAEGQS